jgi:hypothetical protein
MVTLDKDLFVMGGLKVTDEIESRYGSLPFWHSNC